MKYDYHWQCKNNMHALRVSVRVTSSLASGIRPFLEALEGLYRSQTGFILRVFSQAFPINGYVCVVFSRSLFVFFHLAITLCFLQIPTSDYPNGIFKLFFLTYSTILVHNELVTPKIKYRSGFLMYIILQISQFGWTNFLWISVFSFRCMFL
jgi:hypothetical protein